MNPKALSTSAANPLRALCAALTALLLFAAGLVGSAPASAESGGVTATVAGASPTGLTVEVSAAGLPEVDAVYAALIVKGTEAELDMSSGFAAFAMPFPSVAGGEASFTLTAGAAELDRTRTYEVLIWQKHSEPSATTIYARADVEVSAAQWDAVFGPSSGDPGDPSDPGDPGDPGEPGDPGDPAPTGPVLAVDPATGLDPVGDTVTVTGSGYDPAQAVYVFVCSDVELPADLWAHALACRTGAKVIYPSTETDPNRVAFTEEGGFEIEFEVRQVGEGATAVFTAANHTAPTNRTQDAKAALTFAMVSEPTPTPTPTPAPVAGGSLRWAISSGFADYVVGDTAKGSITVTGGATRSGGVFGFGQVSSTYDAATGLGTATYAGTVRFYGHAGALDVSLSSPRVTITSSTGAALSVVSGGSRVVIATLNLGAASRSTSGGAVTYSGAPASLTGAGLNQVFSGYATSLNPVTFTIGAASAAPAGATGTVAAANVAADDSIPSAPPATDGLTLDAAALAAISAGDEFTVTGDGFQPGEKGIDVVVYSAPVLIGTAEADSAGVATWTGRLPTDLPDGEHTLTLQGSVDRGVVFTLDREATPSADGCVVTHATLEWGFKESFRVYVEGIAQGGWSLTEVEYEYPNFVWSEGSGALDPESRTGSVAFDGELNFHGHDGALDTTLSGARVELHGDSGYLQFDITGETQDGATVSADGVRFAQLVVGAAGDAAEDAGDASAPAADAATLTLTVTDVTLTADGAAAFGTYPAGEDLDPASLTLEFDPACADAGESATPSDAPAPVAAGGGGVPVWLWFAVGAALLAGVVALSVALTRRR